MTYTAEATIDDIFCDTAKKSPGQWFKYPHQIKWPEENDDTLDTLRIFANRLRVKAADKWGAMGKNDTGRFRVSMDTRTHEIYMRWELNND